MKHLYTTLLGGLLLLLVLLIVTFMPQSACIAQAQGTTFCIPTNGTIMTSFSPSHQAIDISGAKGFVQGPAVYAPYDGTVVYIGMAELVGSNPNRVKHTLAINHGMINGVYVLSLYVHMGTTTQSYIPANLAVGTTVSRGQLIGYQGFAGQATGAHLHWEIHEYSQPFLNSYTSWGIDCKRTDLWWEFGGNAPGNACNNPNPARAVTPEKYAGSMPLGSSVSASCATVPSKMDINTPGDGQTVAGHFLIGGWAIHEAATSGTGVDAAHIYFDGGAGTGARGVVATYGIRRDDVAAAFGDRYRYSGYHFELESSELSIGQHTIYVYAHSTLTDQWQLMTRTFTVANTLPNIPTLATPTSGATVSGPTVQFTWQDPGDADNRPRNYRDYTIEVKNSAGQVVAQMPWTATTTWSADLADGSYTWHIQSGDGAVGSGWSSDWSFTVSSTIAKPSNLIGEATAGGIRLTWQDNATNETGHRIYRWHGEDLTWPLIGEVAGTEFTDTQVVCGVAYSYLVSAFNSSSESEREGWVDVSMSGCPSLGTPSNFQVSAADTHSLTLSWQDNASNEQGFKIYRWNGVDWPLYATLGPDVTSYTDTNLLCAQGYSYRVAAFNAGGEAIIDGWLDGFTTACPTVPAAPTGLQVAFVTQSGVKLIWQDHADNETSFFIYRRLAADTGAEFLPIALVGANSTVFEDTGLRCSTTYLYQVSAWNDAGESTRTAAVRGATGPCDSVPNHNVVYMPMIRK